MADIPSKRHYAYSFVVNDFAYVGGGIVGTQSGSPLNSFYKYDASKNRWTSIASLPKGMFGGRGFSIGNKGYIALGWNGTGYSKNVWEYDPGTDKWSQKTNFAGNPRLNCSSFTIGDKAYVGLGYDGNTYYNDFYRYDATADEWKRVADYAGSARTAATAFSVSSNGFVGCGYDGNEDLSSFYRYDPNLDS